MAVLLATLRPALADHRDSNDATYTAEQSGVLVTPPAPASEVSTAIGGGDLDDSIDLGAIEYLIFFARCNLINPVVGDVGTFVSPRIQWAQGVSNLDDATVAFTENSWGWVDSGQQVLAPDGGAWTWAKINDLHDISPMGTFFQDTEPASTVMEIRCSEAYAEVWGAPPPFLLRALQTPALVSWQSAPGLVRARQLSPGIPGQSVDPAPPPRSLGAVLASWLPLPFPSQQRPRLVLAGTEKPPFARAWLSRVIERWIPLPPIAPKRRLQQSEAFPVPPAPAPAEECYPRLEVSAPAFSRVGTPAGTFARLAIAGGYARQSLAGFGGARQPDPAEPFDRSSDPECFVIGYGDDYGVNYGGN